MIVTVRLEAEAQELQEIIKDLDVAQKALKLPKEMKVDDEHYERVHDGLFKGRRVFRTGQKGSGITWMPNSGMSGTTGIAVPGQWTYTSFSNNTSVSPQNT